MANVRQVRKGVWECRAYAGVNPATKKKRFESKRVSATSKRAAQKLANGFQEEVDARRQRPADLTFGDFLDGWLVDKKPNLARGSWVSYEAMVRNWLKPHLGAVPLGEVTARQLEGVYRRAKLAGLKGSSANKIHVVASSALSDAHRWELIDKNPAAITKPPTQNRPDTGTPETAELLTLLDAASDLGWETYLQVLAASGARRGEACALRWRSVDWETRSIFICASVHDDGSITDTKNHQVRTVPLDDDTIDILREHHARCVQAAGGPMSPDAFVFSPRPGNTEPFKPHSMTQRFRRETKQLGLDGVKLHGLRHYVGSHLINQGVDVQTVTRRLGHNRNSTTLDLYAHDVGRGDREAADVIGGLLKRDRPANAR
jgi:integrase